MATTSSYDDGVRVRAERRVATDSDLYLELHNKMDGSETCGVFSKGDALKLIDDIKKAIGE